MNRIDKAVILAVAFFLALALLRAALNVAAELAAMVTFLGVIYFAIRLWRSGKLDFLRPEKVVAEPVERK